MFDWLGLSPEATQIVGWVLAAVGAGLLFLAVWTLLRHLKEKKPRGKSVAQFAKNEEKNVQANENELPLSKTATTQQNTNNAANNINDSM